MTAKLITGALMVVALGCGNSTTTTPAPAMPHTTTAKPKALKSVEVAKTMQPLKKEEKKDESGVALTGPERGYLERVDNSGWSGRSGPPEGEAIGGGPKADEDNPYEE